MSHPGVDHAREAKVPTVVVVGGGIAGLAAAWELSSAPVPGSRRPPHVVVLEAAGVLGGKLAAAELGGQRVDVGPDSILARRPEALQLCSELGLSEALVPVGARGASVWARGRPRPLPQGLVLGVPTRLGPLARSGVLGPAALARVAMDKVLPRPDTRGPLGDRAIGPLVARKLGHRVVDVLVDPLVGGIHAGTTADMSAAAVFPLLLRAAQGSGSFMRSLRLLAAQSEGAGAGGGGGEEAPNNAGPRQPNQGAEDPQADNDRPGPAAGVAPFYSLETGMASLVDHLAGALEHRGVELRTMSGVRSLRQPGGQHPCWTLETTNGPLAADGIVLAVPAPQAASLLEAHQDEAPRLLRAVDHSSVAVVTLALASEPAAGDLPGTGLLVPRVARLPRRWPSGDPPHEGPRRRAAPGNRRFLVTAVTYLWRKWPHTQAGGVTLVRASVGRFGDDRAAQLEDSQLVARVTAELQILMGLDQPPVASQVTRWPDAFPQYRVHHPLRVAAIEAAVARLPALALAGATYHGVGIPACIASGRAAGRAVVEALAPSAVRSLG